MLSQADYPLCDRCDGMHRNRKKQVERQLRFLDVYRLHPIIAPAARLAGIHRATVHRWQTDPDFAKAMQSILEATWEVNRAKSHERENARRLWREERERARYAMRCDNLALARAALARAAKRRKESRR